MTLFQVGARAGSLQSVTLSSQTITSTEVKRESGASIIDFFFTVATGALILLAIVLSMCLFPLLLTSGQPRIQCFHNFINEEDEHQHGLSV